MGPEPARGLLSRTKVGVCQEPMDLFDRLKQQLSKQLHTAERPTAAEVHESAEACELVLEFLGARTAQRRRSCVRGKSQRSQPCGQRQASHFGQYSANPGADTGSPPKRVP